MQYRAGSNLIGNALRYAGQEGGPIEIGGERVGPQVRFYVRGHGQGIPEADRTRIFEVFYRGSTGKHLPGSGVGLATVQKIARLYGGGRVGRGASGRWRNFLGNDGGQLQTRQLRYLSWCGMSVRDK